MVKDTGRDAIWNRAMVMALEGNSFTLRQIRNWVNISGDGPSDRTTRDVLNTMVEYQWLEKESPKAHTWRPGPTARRATDLQRIQRDEPI